MRKLYAELNKPYEWDPATKRHLAVGTAAHALFMEPGLYETEIAYYSGSSRSGLKAAKDHPGEFNPSTVKIGRMVDQKKIDAKIESDRQKHERAIREWQELENVRVEFDGREVLLESWREEVEELVAVARQNTELVELFDGAEIERSIQFEMFGVQMKMRPDSFRILGREIHLTDLKTTANAEAGVFGNRAAGMKYRQKMSAYVAGLEHVFGLRVTQIKLGVIETTWPYDSAVYELDRNTDIEEGWSEVEPVIHAFKACIENNYWQGLADVGCQPLKIPNWSMQEEELDWEGV